jgi:VanZ family protein
MDSGAPHTPANHPLATRRGRQLAPPVLGIVALMLFLAFGRPPGDALAWRTVFELGHVPLFGVTALLMLRVVRLLRIGERPENADFLVAFLATAVLSLASEAAQIGQASRDASVGDAVNNLIGALCFLAAAAALRPRLWRGLGADGPVAARLVLVIATLTLALAVWPLAGVAWSYGMRRAALPVLADFGAAWQRPFLNVARSELERVSAPPGWTEQAGREVARLTFRDAPWPGVTVREPWPDWSGYEALRFQVWSELESPVEIVLQVDDGHRERKHRDRFNGSFIVTPGLNDFTVPLATIARGPREREMDLSDIRQFIVFSRRPEEPFQLYFSRIWLEDAAARIAAAPRPH